MNGSKRWLTFEIVVVAVVALGVIGYLCTTNAQQAGASGEVPGQGWLTNPLLNWPTHAAVAARYQYRQWRRPQPTTAAAWVVTGAGDERANGAWKQTGTFDREPLYRNAAGWYMFFWAPENAWGISSAVVGPIYLATQGQPLPGGWWKTTDPHGGKPPTVTLSK